MLCRSWLTAESKWGFVCYEGYGAVHRVEWGWQSHGSWYSINTASSKGMA